MKLTLSFLIVLTSLNTLANHLRDVSANQVQYLHCQPLNAKASDLVVHYIVKMNSAKAESLYIGSAQAGTRTLELKNLAVIRESLQTTSIENSDLNFSSGQMQLQFSLTAQDTRGQFFEGQLHDKNQTVPISCRDVALEL